MAQASGDLDVMLTVPLPRKYCLSFAEKFQGLERVTGSDKLSGFEDLRR